VANLDKIAKAFLYLLHQYSFTRTIIVVVLYTFWILYHHIVDSHGFLSGVVIEQAAQTKRHVKRISFQSNPHQVLDKMDDHVFRPKFRAAGLFFLFFMDLRLDVNKSLEQV
jgi:hypothetical protein